MTDLPTIAYQVAADMRKRGDEATPEEVFARFDDDWEKTPYWLLGFGVKLGHILDRERRHIAEAAELRAT